MPYLWIIIFSWSMFTHEKSVLFKYQHYEYTHISQQIITSNISTGNNQETMSHKDIVSYQSPFKKSLHVKDWSGLDNMPICHIPVFIMRIYASRVLFLITIITHMCHGCVCVWDHVCLSQVSQDLQDRESLCTESQMRSLTSKWWKRWMGWTSMSLAVFTWTERTWPSRPGYSSWITPKGHCNRGDPSSWMRTTDPTFKLSSNRGPL